MLTALHFELTTGHRAHQLKHDFDQSDIWFKPVVKEF